MSNNDDRNLTDTSSLLDFHELKDAVKERIYERAKSPFVSAFIIAWAIINFRVIYTLITSDGYVEAYQIIDSKIWPDFIAKFSMALIFPMLSTFLYLLGVPYLEEKAVRIWMRGKVRVRNARDSIEETVTLDAKSIKDYENQIALAEQENLSKLSQLSLEHNNQASKLINSINILRNKNCRSIHLNEDAKQALHNMNEIERLVLSISNRLQKNHGSIDSNILFEEIKKIHPDTSRRIPNQIIRNFSSECYINDTFEEVLTSVTYTLSERGRNLVDVMVNEGFIPGMLRPMTEEELLGLKPSHSEKHS